MAAADILQADAVLRQRRGFDLDPPAGSGALPLTLTPADALNLRQALKKRVRRVRRLTLMSTSESCEWPMTGQQERFFRTRIARQRAGQVRMPATDGRCTSRAAPSMSRSTPKVSEYSSCPRARGGHVVDIGDGAEVPLKGVATVLAMTSGLAPGSCRRDEDRRHIDAPAARHRQQHEPPRPAQCHAGGQEYRSPPADG